MISINFIKIGSSFAENNIFQKSKMAAKMANMLWNGCFHSNSLAMQKLLICQSMIFYVQPFGKSWGVQMTPLG